MTKAALTYLQLNSLISHSDQEITLAIVCYDAGGANQIVAQLSKIDSKMINFRIMTEGPAADVFVGRFENNTFKGSIADALAGAQVLLSGTGWASSLEHNARKVAKRGGIYSIALLDHWVNYAQRFVRNGETVLPDEIWVVDEYALRLAQQTFSSLKISLMPDCYSDLQVNQIIHLAYVANNELLYLMEPIRSDWGRGEPGEFQALRYFAEHLQKLDLPADTVIRLRPHPSDEPGKYDEFLSVFGHHQAFLDDGDLTHALSRARWVAGCQTYAMTLALKAGRTVYCTLPPWAPACVLPHTGLIQIRNLVAI